MKWDKHIRCDGCGRRVDYYVFDLRAWFPYFGCWCKEEKTENVQEVKNG